MTYNFKNLAGVELLPEVPENATTFAEVDGVVKRVPSQGLGGGIEFVFIYHYVQTQDSQMIFKYETNKTQQEVVQILRARKPIIFIYGNDNSQKICNTINIEEDEDGNEEISIEINENETLMWNINNNINRY